MALFRSKTNQKSAERNGPLASAKAPPCLTRLSWLGLKAADVVAEALFLEEKLGLRFLDEGNSSSGHHVRYNCGTLELELVTGGTTWATRPKPRRGQPDLPLIPSFSLDNIQHLATRLNEQEALTTQIYEQGWAASFFFVDPERNLWQINETRIEPAIATEEPTHIAALWLSAEDYPAQLVFYRDVLGLPLSEDGVRPRPITSAAETYQRENPVEEVTEDISDHAEAESRLEANPSAEGAVFFSEGARLALSPGGKRLEDNAERVWGRDSAFLPGFQTNNLPGFAARLKEAGVKATEPFPYVRYQLNRYRTTSALRFVDPEGNCWQVSD